MRSGAILDDVEFGHETDIQARERITVLAHDLKNLLTPLRNRVDLISKRADRENRGRDLRDAKEAILAIERLNQLITDLLDAERLDQGLFTLRLAPVELVRMARETAEMLHGSSKIHVRAAGEISILADASRLRQALENVITNAVQHSPPGKPVTVTVEVERHAGGEWAIVTIADEGPGIPPDRIPFLFQRYQPGVRSNGLGLGLFLAQGIAWAHGGTLTADSSPGDGTRFRLSLPTGAFVATVAVLPDDRHWRVATGR